MLQHRVGAIVKEQNTFFSPGQKVALFTLNRAFIPPFYYICVHHINTFADVSLSVYLSRLMWFSWVKGSGGFGSK